jgi:hypothetical protein
MSQVKLQEYQSLIEKFKNKDYQEFNGELLNPFSIEHNKSPLISQDHLNPWAHWHGNLNAEIVLIGQDWGDTKFFIENGGKDPDGNPTNESLRTLFLQLGIDIGTPNSPTDVPLYFTNAVLGIKKGEMATAVKVKWYASTKDEYLKPLIDEIIQPKIIITMGSVAFDVARRMYSLEKMNFTGAIVKGVFDLPNDKLLFPVAHCSGLGKRNRGFEAQIGDWQKIKEYVKEKSLLSFNLD